jgi:hypothetical protein
MDRLYEAGLPPLDSGATVRHALAAIVAIPATAAGWDEANAARDRRTSSSWPAMTPGDSSTPKSPSGGSD